MHNNFVDMHAAFVEVACSDGPRELDHSTQGPGTSQQGGPSGVSRLGPLGGPFLGLSQTPAEPGLATAGKGPFSFLIAFLAPSFESFVHPWKAVWVL